MRERGGADYETLLDAIRRVVGEQRFALGVQLVEARHDPLDIAAGLSRLAEAALEVGRGSGASGIRPRSTAASRAAISSSSASGGSAAGR